MNLTTSTFLFFSSYFVLARSSVATTLVLPPAMAFPFIPVLAYTLIISAFSYISARILKRFHFSSDLLAFLRRKGRLTALPITHSHELLPTSTASPLARPSIGVYADSSNVTPRSTSLDALSVLPSRLISPASSPPGYPQPRRVTNPPLTSFSILKPTLYRHEQRRSRSLGTPISRPPHWLSHFPPSPPMPQETVRRRNSEEDIPLSILSRTAEHLSHEHRTLPAPIFHASSTSTSMPDSDFHSSIYGPLIDISLPPLSPVSTSLSSRQNSSLAGLSDSGSNSELTPYPYPTTSDSGSPSSISMSAQSSDIGMQPISDLRGFAYDWRFNNGHCDKDDPRADFQEPSPLPLLPSVTFGEHITTVVAEKQRNEDVSYDSQSAEMTEQVTSDATQINLTQASALVQLDAPSLTDDIGQSAHASPVILQSELNVDEIDRHSSLLISGLAISSPFNGSKNDADLSYPKGDDRAIHDDEMIMGSLDDILNEPNSSILSPSLCVVVQDANIQERPPIAIDTSESVEASDSLSARVEAYPSLISSSQTPTPPASPPLTPASTAKASIGYAKSQIRVTTILPTSAPSSPMKATEEIVEAAEGPFEPSLASQELAQGGPEYGDSIIEDITGPTRSDASPPCSPTSALPARSICAADVPPLGFSATQVVSVQDEVLWSNASKDVQKLKADEVSGNSAEKTIEPVAEGQAESVLSIPTKTSPGSESKGPTLIQKQAANEPASSTTVSMASHRRQVVRRLPIDVALAMQLRPGLGVGADPAWMVRFMMALFSWFTIMIAGRGGEVDAYAS